MATEINSAATAIYTLSTTLYSFEAALTLVLVFMSLLLRALIGKDATFQVWVNSFLQSPGDIAFAATSFLIAVLLKHPYSPVAVVIVFILFFALLLVIYWVQHCAQKNLIIERYWKMSGQQITGLMISIFMSMYTILKLTQQGSGP